MNNPLIESTLDIVIAELRKAQIEHPDWPDDYIHRADIVAEEAGELVKASLEHHYEGKCPKKMYWEAVQTAATAIRFLLNYP